MDDPELGQTAPRGTVEDFIGRERNRNRPKGGRWVTGVVVAGRAVPDGQDFSLAKK